MFPETKLEKARKEFLDECDLVVRIPAVYFLKGNSLISWAIVHLTPLYYYVGIKLNAGGFQVEKKLIRNNDSIMYDIIENKYTYEKVDLEEERSRCNHLVENVEKVLSSGIKINKKTIINFKKSAFKIWSEIPDNYFIEKDYLPLGLSILICCLDRNVNPLDFNRCKKEHKIAKIEKSLIFHDIFKICWLLLPYSNAAAYLASLFGIRESKQEKMRGVPGLFYQIPFPKGIKTDRELSNLFNNLKNNMDENTLIGKYVNEIITGNKIKTRIIPDISKGEHIAILRWNGGEKSLFGEVLSPLFLAGLSPFSIKIGLCDDETEEINCLDSVTYKSKSLRLKGSYSGLMKAGRDAEELGKGWVYYFSGRSRHEFEGARLLDPEEYKLPKPPKGKRVSERPKPEVKEEKLEINFTETEVQISGQQALSKDVPFILAEYIILKEKVHWLWSFVILPEFEVKSPKKQFKNYISKNKGILKENGIKIAALKKIDDDYAILESIEDSVKSNIRDVKDCFVNAISFFEQHKFKEAIDELSNITKSHYKWYSFTEAYLKLIECIRMNNFEDISEQVIITCRDFSSWYSKRLCIGLSRIEHYNKKLLRDKNKLDALAEGELKKIKEELHRVEDNLQALIQKSPLSSQNAEYENFAEFLIDIQDKVKYVMEQETVPEEKRQEVCIQVIIKSQNKNECFDSLIKEAFERIGDESYKLDKRAKKARSDRILQDESKEIYWFICELLFALENFDDFEFTQGSKLGMLINYFKEGMESKIGKWLKGRL